LHLRICSPFDAKYDAIIDAFQACQLKIMIECFKVFSAAIALLDYAGVDVEEKGVAGCS